MSQPHSRPEPLPVDAEYDLTIVGAGPVGLFAAFYAGLRTMKVKLIDSLAEPGGQLAALYPDKYIYDVAGFPAVKAKDLVAQLTEQAMQYSPTVCLNEQATTLATTDGGYTIGTSTGATHRTKTVLLTAGIGYFAPRKLPDAALARFEGRAQWFLGAPSWLLDRSTFVVGTRFGWALPFNTIGDFDPRRDGDDRDVAAAAWVLVPPPGATDATGLVVHLHAQADLTERVECVHPREAGADETGGNFAGEDGRQRVFLARQRGDRTAGGHLVGDHDVLGDGGEVHLARAHRVERGTAGHRE